MSPDTSVSGRRQGELPPRFECPPAWAWVTGVALVAALIHGLWASGLTPAALWDGLPAAARFAERAFPPSLERIDAVAWATLETFEMAVVGTVLGVLFSLPLAFMAAVNTTPHKLLYAAARGLIAVMRAIPDIVWALLFIVFVGLGPKAGILAITVDTIGFCGRFFAERIEEVAPHQIEALDATGATRTGVIVGAILPAAMPSGLAPLVSVLVLEVGVVGLATGLFVAHRGIVAISSAVVVVGLVLFADRVRPPAAASQRQRHSEALFSPPKFRKELPPGRSSSARSSVSSG